MDIKICIVFLTQKVLKRVTRYKPYKKKINRYNDNENCDVEYYSLTDEYTFFHIDIMIIKNAAIIRIVENN